MTAAYDLPPDFKIGYFTNEDGKSIRYGYVQPEGGTRGTVILQGGYNDTLESHADTINEYRNQGFSVWTMDWAGYGGSEHYDSSNPMKPPGIPVGNHVRDLHHFRNHVVGHDERTPTILHAHSFGGLIGLSYLSQHAEGFDGAVLAAPMVHFDGPGPDFMMRANVNAKTALGLGDDYVIPGPEKLAEYLANQSLEPKAGDPPLTLRHKNIMAQNPGYRVGPPTAAWTKEALTAADALKEEGVAEKIDIPILVAIGENDARISPDNLGRLTERLPNATTIIYRGSDHVFWREESAGDTWRMQYSSFAEDVKTQFTARNSGAEVGAQEIVPNPASPAQEEGGQNKLVSSLPQLPPDAQESDRRYRNSQAPAL